jgi:hypothetical protein
MGITEEAGKAVSGAVSAMSGQPLSLALVIMNLVLLGYLFYVGSSTNSQRKETVDLIVGWQKETDRLMANCVSGEVTRTMLDNMQRITETMLSAEQKEIQRMQDVVNQERQRSWELRERERKRLEGPSEEPQPKEQKLNYWPPLPRPRPLSYLPLPPVGVDIPWLPADGH